MIVIKRSFFLLFLIGLISTELYSQSIQLQVLEPKPGSYSLCKLQFENPVVLDSTASFIVKFPSNFGLQKIKVVGSNNIKGGFEFVVNDSTVSLNRSGLGPQILPNKKLSVVFGPVRIPEDLASRYSAEFTIQSKSDSKITSRSRIIFIEK